MPRYSPTVVTLLATALLLPCCTDGAERIDLIITQEASVFYGGIAAGEMESQEIHYDNLKKEADYVTHAQDLVCGTLQVTDSFIEVTRLEATDAATSLIVQLEVQGSEAIWTPLASFEGDVRERDIYSLDHDLVWLDDTGAALLPQIALDDQPVFDARVTVAPTVDLQDLALTLRLQVMLSSDVEACP